MGGASIGSFLVRTGLRTAAVPVADEEDPTGVLPQVLIVCTCLQIALLFLVMHRHNSATCPKRNAATKLQASTRGRISRRMSKIVEDSWDLDETPTTTSALQATMEVEPSWGEITPAGRKGAKAQPAVTDYRTAVRAEQDLGSRRALRWPCASVSEDSSPT